MAENYHSCARRLSPNLDWKIMVFSGGLAQKLKILREIIQQKFQMPYRLTATAEDTLMGLLIMALVCKGEFASSVSEITEEIWLKGVNGHQWT
jgi:sugar (pentulose or hexulose) kinase